VPRETPILHDPRHRTGNQRLILRKTVNFEVARIDNSVPQTSNITKPSRKRNRQIRPPFPWKGKCSLSVVGKADSQPRIGNRKRPFASNRRKTWKTDSDLSINPGKRVAVIPATSGWLTLAPDLCVGQSRRIPRAFYIRELSGPRPFCRGWYTKYIL
jgi:hypothetical protein